MKRSRGIARWFPAALLLVAWSAWVAARGLTLPNAAGSLKFAVLGDFGTGETQQHEVAAQMAAAHQTFRFPLVITTGDNLVGPDEVTDVIDKARRPLVQLLKKPERNDRSDIADFFEQPFELLLKRRVRFYASLGNHDAPVTLTYPRFNMKGRRYYTFAVTNVRFLMLDSNLVDSVQLGWIDATLRRSRERWKIVVFHHPIYSANARHGPSIGLRTLLEPLFVKHRVNVVFSGHNHAYERIRPQHGIYYFVNGPGGQRKLGTVKADDDTAAAFDLDQSFMLVEIIGDRLFFEALSRTGTSVDSGVIDRRRTR